MSNCKICFDKCGEKLMKRTVDDVCPLCKPVEEPLEDACVCPPLGEPKLLTVAAPVVFDECGINLCKVTNLVYRL